MYLRTTPETAWQRVKARARSEEKVIPIEYLKVRELAELNVVKNNDQHLLSAAFLQELHDLHESWLMNGEAEDLPAPVLVIDANQDIERVPDIYSKHEKAVMGEIRAAQVDDSENVDPTPSIASKTGAVTMAASSPRKVLAKV